jgi:hypothetical protein
MPFQILISTADFQKRFDFPYICATTTKSFLSRQRETVKKVETQIKEAVSRKPSVNLRFEDLVDESIVRELEKSGFIDKVYR